MVKHIVFWKVKDNDEKQKNIETMIEMLKSLVGKIEGLVSIEVGYNFNEASDYDVVLYASFKNPVALKYYQTHPEHVKCKEFISQVTTSRAAADYFFDSETAASKPLSEVADVPEDVIEVPQAASVPEITIEAPKPSVPEITVEAPKANVPEITVEAPKPSVPEITVEAPQQAPNAFGVEINTGDTLKTNLPNIQQVEEKMPVQNDFVQQFEDVQPSVQGYNPQIKTEDKFEQTNAQQNYQSPDLSYIKAQGTETTKKQNKFENNLNDQAEKNYAEPLEPLDFSNVPPAEPMRFGPDSPSYNFGYASHEKPKNVKMNDTPVSTPVAQPRTPSRAAATPDHAQVNPVSTEYSKVKETTSAFGKKKIDVEVTPLDQRSDTWTCPNCGKIMPKYVGTCGCGEVQPFDFGEPSAPAAPMKYDRAPAQPSAPARQPSQPRTPTRTNRAAATPDHAQVNPVSTEYSKVKETTSAFGKKKIDVEVTPLDQRSDTWTCPNCGKIMPKYVGTCGCGEVQPFDFDEPEAPAAPMTYDRTPAQPSAPARQPAPRTSTRTNRAAATPDHAQVNPVSTEYSKVKETTSAFGKKKIDVEVTPLDQRSDTWICPNCGKIMPKYVGTCGCGEVQPFDFDEPTAPVAPMTYDRTPAQPSAPARQPAPRTSTRTNRAAATPDHAQVNPVSTEYSKVKETTSAFGKKKLDVEVTPLEQRSDTWTCPNCGKIMPKYVGTCGCGEVQPFDFDEPAAPAAPMTYDRTPSQPSAPARQPAQRTSSRTSNRAAATPDHAQVNPVSTEYSKVKETTSAFGKKKLDVEVTPLEQRSDTWTCPNCGKIMPKYVGTCGCGEVQPFDFDEPAAPAAPTTYDRTPAQPARQPAQRTSARTSNRAAATPDHAQVNPVSTEYSKVKETTSAFGKKKLDVEVTPLEQRSDTWTCPNCGKIMPKYVGTCGCGEVQPFDFDEPAAPAAPMTYDRTPAQPARQPAQRISARTSNRAAATPDHAQVNPVSTEYSKVKETTSAFGKKKLDVEVTPLEQRSDTWTCPNCGKIMPKYVGTCGCGEPQPFDFG